MKIKNISKTDYILGGWIRLFPEGHKRAGEMDCEEPSTMFPAGHVVEISEECFKRNRMQAMIDSGVAKLASEKDAKAPPPPRAKTPAEEPEEEEDAEFLAQLKALEEADKNAKE